ncbi:hypothetical protein, partial [Tetragenococcus halophilus]|uniref:hypothetical protein n=1 Tax=Tetragenococcus halophilus TaxID=51669 RepID=UPI001F1DADA9
HLFSPFILVSNLIIKETNAFLLYKKLVLLLIFLVTTLNIIDPLFVHPEGEAMKPLEKRACQGLNNPWKNL